MSVPNRVKFHITEAGPKKCVAVKFCPKSPEADHYDNYVDAAKTYEDQLASSRSAFAPVLTKTINLSYEALKSPQPEDISRTALQVKGFYYTGTSEMGAAIGDLHRELRFDNQIENIVTVAPEDLEKLQALRAEAIKVKKTNAPNAFAKNRDIQAAIEDVLSNYRGRDSYGPYKEFLDPYFKDSPAIQKIITEFATPLARAQVFSRALDNHAEIPQEISLAFETVWNSDEFTPGSQAFIEKEIATAIEKKEALLTSDNQEKFANELGFPSSKQASYALTNRATQFRDYFTHRGRNYPETVSAVVAEFKPFGD